MVRDFTRPVMGEPTPARMRLDLQRPLGASMHVRLREVRSRRWRDLLRQPTRLSQFWTILAGSSRWFRHDRD
jgi:hypothetical protein